MTTHTIRLKHFWISTVLPTGRVRFTRSFGKPRTLDANETVWIVASSSPGTGTATLNGTCLGNFEANVPFAFEISGLLSNRNEVCLEIVTTVELAIEDIVLEFRQTEIERPLSADE